MIGWFHLKQGVWAFNVPKAALGGKEWISIFIQTNAKFNFPQVWARNKWVGNMLMYVDVKMKRQGFVLKITNFNDSESALFFETQ